MAPLLATPPLPDDSDAPQGAPDTPEADCSANSSSLPSLEHPSSEQASQAPLDDFVRLQRRLILATLIVAALAVAITALVFDLHIASSLLVGALAGVLYLRLLARSVSKLGDGSKKVG